MSPIHDQSYRHYTGERRPVGRSWGVIAVTGLRSVLARKLFLAILFCAFIPFIVRTIQLYLVTIYPQVGNELAPVDARMFMKFIEEQSFFVFLVTIFVGAGLIANDRRANALQIYLSKPLMRMEYIGGKLTILVSLLLFITLVPGLLLVLLQIGFAGSLAFVRANLHVVPAIVLASTLRVFVAALAMLALSSLSKSTRYVAILYTGVIFFTEAMFGVLTAVTGSTRIAWVSITANIENVTDVMFRQEPRYETPVALSLLILLGLLAVSVSVLERRVRGVEIVK
jgi:ABC-type transport system involved in multi-copper enzyme maturation permease subunit